MIRDGQRVGFVGDGEPQRIGDVGKVLSSSGTAAHVLWSTGSRAGQITLEDADDLTATSSRVAEIDAVATVDSIGEGGLVSFAARDIFDVEGEVGLLNRLNEDGHLAAFSQVAEEALEFVAGRIRHDPSFCSVLGQLEPEEGASLVSLAAVTLLRDAFGEVA